MHPAPGARLKLTGEQIGTIMQVASALLPFLLGLGIRFAVFSPATVEKLTQKK